MNRTVEAAFRSTQPSLHRKTRGDQSAVAPGEANQIGVEYGSYRLELRSAGRVEHESVRLLVVDDHSVVRHGAATLLRQQPGYEVVGEAKTAKEAIAQAILLQPDVVLMDIGLGDEGGLYAADKIGRACLNTSVVAFSASADPVHVKGMFAAGAKAYVLKTSEATVMLAAIRTALSGSHFLDPALSDALIEELQFFPKASRRPRAVLTPQQNRVLERIVWGYTNREIAAQLLVKRTTVNCYRLRICDKLGLKSKAELVRYGIAAGLLATREAAKRPSVCVLQQDLDRTTVA